MSTEIPKDFRDLFQKKAFAHFATRMPDGSPQSTPVWIDYDGRHILVNTARGRQKERNVRRHPEVAISIADPENPYRYLQVRGRVVDFDVERADEHIDQLARRYLGQERYPFRGPGEARIILRIAPEHISGQGHG
jgi:PPOX class probable F420-dependent enzyme